MFEILAVVLHLGNVEIVSNSTGEVDADVSLFVRMHTRLKSILT